MKKIIIVCVLGLFLSGCNLGFTEIKNGEKYESNGVENTVVGNTSRFIDKEAGVVCWKYSSSISCLPLSETKLGDE